MMRAVCCVMVYASLVLVASVEEDTCGVVPGFKAHGRKLQTVQLTSFGAHEQDAECCAACNARPDCEFWVRGTRKPWCHLMHHWTTTLPQGETRSGFKGQHKTLCSVVKLVYGLVGNIMKLIPISLGKTIRNFHIEMPNDIDCILASNGPSNYVAVLGNLKVGGVGSFEAMGAKGSVQFLLEADPIFDINLGTCKAEVSMPGIWNLGPGVNNYGKHKWITNWLSGPDHSNVRNDCSGLLPAYPGQSLDGGKRIASQSFDMPEGDFAQEELDKKCCELCNANPECEGFEIHDHDPSKKKSCYLHHFSKLNDKANANWRGQNITMGRMKFQGGHNVGISKGTMVQGSSQAEINNNCAQLCDESQACEVWSSDVNKKNANCYLRSLNEKRGLLNKGIFGIHGYSIVNWLGKRFLRSHLNKILQHSHICQLDALFHKLLGLAESADLSIKSAEALVSLEVADSFFSTFDPENLDSWGNQSFTVLEKKLVGSMTANDPALQFLVDDVLKGLEEYFAGPMGDQLGSPFAFFIGGLLSNCIHNPHGCGKGGLDSLVV